MADITNSSLFYLPQRASNPNVQQESSGATGNNAQRNETLQNFALKLGIDKKNSPTTTLYIRKNTFKKAIEKYLLRESTSALPPSEIFHENASPKVDHRQLSRIAEELNTKRINSIEDWVKNERTCPTESLKLFDSCIYGTPSQTLVFITQAGELAMLKRYQANRDSGLPEPDLYCLRQSGLPNVVCPSGESISLTLVTEREGSAESGRGTTSTATGMRIAGNRRAGIDIRQQQLSDKVCADIWAKVVLKENGTSLTTVRISKECFRLIVQEHKSSEKRESCIRKSQKFGAPAFPFVMDKQVIEVIMRMQAERNRKKLEKVSNCPEIEEKKNLFDVSCSFIPSQTFVVINEAGYRAMLRQHEASLMEGMEEPEEYVLAQPGLPRLLPAKERETIEAVTSSSTTALPTTTTTTTSTASAAETSDPNPDANRTTGGSPQSVQERELTEVGEALISLMDQGDQPRGVPRSEGTVRTTESRPEHQLGQNRKRKRETTLQTS